MICESMSSVETASREDVEKEVLMGVPLAFPQSELVA